MPRGRPSSETPRRSIPRSRGLDLVVVGHTNLDYFFHVKQLPRPDRTVPVEAREVRLGGTAANVARAAAKLGVRTALVSLVGPDFPRPFRNVLVKEGVDLSAFQSVGRARSPAAFIIETAGGEQVTLLDQGPMESDSGTAVPLRLLSAAGWVHLATGNPHYQLRVLDAARRLGVRVAVDPAQEIFYRWAPRALRRLLAGAELFFANRAELTRAVELLRLNGVRELLQIVPMVVETRGRWGATAWTRMGPVQVRAARPQKMRQVTGAGDGFRGGFYSAWFRGEPLRECLRTGTRVAARWLETGDPSALRRLGTRPHPLPDLSRL